MLRVLANEFDLLFLVTYGLPIGANQAAGAIPKRGANGERSFYVTRPTPCSAPPPGSRAV